MMKHTKAFETFTKVQMTLLYNTSGNNTSTMWGDELIEMWDHIRDVVDVKWFFRPFELVKNETPEFLAAFLQDKELELKDVKGEILRTLGLLGKNQNKASQTRVFALESEAQFFRSTYGGTVEPYRYNLRKIDVTSLDSTSDVVYVWQSPLLCANLESGFLPIYHRVLSGTRMILARMVLQLEAAGMVPLGANTDAIFCAEADVKLMTTFDKRDPANLGCITCKPKALPSKGEIGTACNVDTVSYPLKLRPRRRFNDIELDHENANEMAAIVRVRDGIVLARAPGAGKTTILLKAFGVLHREALIVVQSNVRVGEVRAEGFAACTYAAFLGLRVQNGRLVDTETGATSILRADGTSASVHDFRTIMFDELATLASSERGRLTRRIETLRNLENPPTLWATADIHQNPPIEYAVNPLVDQKAYISKWCRDLFPTAVTLHKLRRWKRPECQELVLRLRHMLFDERCPVSEAFALFPRIKRADIPVGAHIVSYTRHTRRELNHFMHRRLHDEDWVLGGRIVYDSHTRVHGWGKLYKNFEYVITSVNADNIDLCDVSDQDSTFRVTYDQAAAWFAYAFANTCHSAQGSTYDMPIVIADSAHFRVTREWALVALTRNRDTRTVFILEGEAQRKPVDKRAIQRRIDGHNAADVAAGREVGNLTVEWVLERFAQQNGICAVCKAEMEMPRVGETQGKGALISIDRVVSKGRGHVRGNSQLVHYACNCAKGAR